MTAPAKHIRQPVHDQSQSAAPSILAPGQKPLRVGVVDPDGPVGNAVLTMYGQVEPFVTDDLEHARKTLLAHPVDAVIVGFQGQQACSLLDSLTRLPEAPEVLLLLSADDTPLANWSRMEGIGDTLPKPTTREQLSGWLSRVAQKAQNQGSGVIKRSEFGAGRILGRDPAVTAMREQVMRVAGFAGMPVLITGETGTGKELVARAIHELSSPDEPFVSVNCSAIPENLFESELFGHTAGAFTGAQGPREGLFSEARGGTIFLDEVGELPDSMQAKLLSVLETRRFRPVGATRELPLEARIVSASNAPLTEEKGKFRQDLFYRLAGFTIRTPGLKARSGDIPILARHFVRNFCESYDRPVLSLSEDAIHLLRSHGWPGNIRELQGTVETACVNTQGRSITAETLEPILDPPAPFSITNRQRSSSAENEPIKQEPPETDTFGEPLVGDGRPFPSLPELERHAILTAFEEARGNLSRAARILGIPRSTLRDRLRRFGIASKG